MSCAWPSALPLLLLTAAPLLAQGRVTVHFEVDQGTRWGESVYLMGDLPELGADDPTRAPKLVHQGQGRWSLDVSLPAARPYRFAYLLRQDDPAALARRDNARQLGPTRQAVTPAGAARQVRVRYLSGWARARLVHRQPDGTWAAVEMQASGAGRGGSERAYTAAFETRAPELELRFEDGAGGRDLAPGGAPYRTGFAAFTVIDGSVCAAADGPLPTPGRGRVVRIPAWRSNLLGNERPVLIYLPRSYERDPQRRYPVLYAHDGQNLFLGEGMFGGWHLDEALDDLIARGRMREVIVVGVGNTSARMDEYIPDEDEGHASRYGRFLSEELKPWVDQNLRTLPGPADTGLLGSSLGGLVSVYLAWERPETFGRAGSLSGSFWLDAWVKRRLPGAPRARLYLDSGTAGSSGDSVWDTLGVRDALLAQGQVLGRDLLHVIDPGAAHQEPYWRARVGQALEWLFPAE